MDLKMNDIEFSVPTHINDVSLDMRIGYDVQYGDDLNEIILKITSNEKMPPAEKEAMLMEIYFDRAQKTFAYFANLELDVVHAFPIGEVVAFYEGHLKEFIEMSNESLGVQSFLINNRLYWLPDIELLPSTQITFNEFVTAREITRNLNEKSSDKLTAIAYIGAIFFRPQDDKFIEMDIDDSAGRIEFMFNLPLPIAMQIGIWYDAWSDNIQKNFSIFDKAKIKGIDMSAHFDKWGWISFLNFVSKNGTIFYKSNNMSNLDNIKAANLYEVLIWASCEKDQEDIISMYYDAMQKKMKASA